MVGEATQTPTWVRVLKWAVIGVVLAGPVIGPLLIFTDGSASYQPSGQAVSLDVACGSVVSPKSATIAGGTSFDTPSIEITRAIQANADQSCDAALRLRLIVGAGFIVVGVAGWIVAARRSLNAKNPPARRLGGSEMQPVD